jgi:serine/threonine-protein kinase
MLTRAGFDPAKWRAVTPERNPPIYANARAAWEGTWPTAPAVPVRLEAAALDGKPVYFEAVFPWTPPPSTPSPLLTPNQRAANLSILVALAVTILSAAVFAQRNVRAGRGDRRGARRLSAFVFIAVFVSWFFGESHVATVWEVALVVMALAASLLTAAFCWMAYLAAEPFLRRHSPEVLISWTRLLAGELRDPLVGRDVLIGCAAGPLVAAAAIVSLVLPEWRGQPASVVFADFYGVVYGIQAVVPLLVWRAAQAVVAGLLCVFLLLVLRLVLRSPWAAAAVFVFGTSAIFGFAAGTDHFVITFSSSVINLAAFVWLIVRFGLLAAVAQFYVWGLFIFFPVTGDLSAWYAGGGVTALVVLAALTLYGFTTALGGRPALGTARP